MDKLQEFERLLSEARRIYDEWKKRKTHRVGGLMLRKYRQLALFVEYDLPDRFNFHHVDILVRQQNTDEAVKVEKEIKRWLKT